VRGYSRQEILAGTKLPDLQHHRLIPHPVTTLTHSETLKGHLQEHQNQPLAAEYIRSHGSIDWEAWQNVALAQVLQNSEKIFNER
jgi:hypothetical protein